MNKSVAKTYTGKGQIGIYIHWPFCLSKCPYCDFNTYESREIDIDQWLAAYKLNIAFFWDVSGPGELCSIFFGGGTPSLMPPVLVEKLIDTIAGHWNMAPDIEITMEANPTSTEAGKFAAFRRAGVNRLSLGVQALNDRDLHFLGRNHNTREALDAIECARGHFARYSFDLIYARPGQTLEDWLAELESARDYIGDHMSLYQLTIERSTPFYMRRQRNEFQMPEDDQAADFYHVTQEVMKEFGLPAYEVSNHARMGQESRHNLIYWRYQDYAGIGPGAHGRLSAAGMRFESREHRAPDIWLQQRKTAAPPHIWQEITAKDQFMEGLLMGLRLQEGLDIEELAFRSGAVLGEMIDFDNVDRLAAAGFLSREEMRLTLSREGMLRLNTIVPYIMKDD